MPTTKVLYFHGAGGGPDGFIGARLASIFDLYGTKDRALDGLDIARLVVPSAYRETVRAREMEFASVRPDVLVGASFGARLALELGPHAVPRVLIAPAVGGLPALSIAMAGSILERPRPSTGVSRRYLRSGGPRTIIVHCTQDPVLSIEGSRVLARAIGAELRAVEYDGRPMGGRSENHAKHSLAFEAGLAAIERAVRDVSSG